MLTEHPFRKEDKKIIKRYTQLPDEITGLRRRPITQIWRHFLLKIQF